MDNKKKEYIIFRLQDGTDLSGSLKHWDDSVMYDETRISTIENSNTATTVAPTSIPSPFARMDLARTAFANVAKDLEGAAKMYQKIVSDTLDVAEIFFNYDKLRDKVEIIVWDKTTDLANMIQSQSVMGRTLEKFINRDSDSFHFDKLKRLYILNYIGPDRPKQMNIIGATSPVTLFFSVANEQNEKGDDLSYVSPNIHFGQDMPFDKGFQPLYNRDDEFVKYLYAFQKSVPQFASLFPEVNSYLDECHKLLRDDLKDAILNQSAVTVNDYEKLHLGNDFVEILGFHYHKRPDIKPRSDFEISSSVYQGAVKPLVLPVESGNRYASLQYVIGEWGNTNKAPYKSNIDDVDQRTLPFDGSKCSYLTINDFLEETIIKVPHTLNKKYFFDGNIKDIERQSAFLLPVKPLYFKYFPIDTLKSQMPDGKLAFEIEPVAGGSVKVIIRIPIIGNKSIRYIEYQRIYYAQMQANVSETQNSGGMTTFDFSGLVMPSMKFKNEDDAIYTVSCVSTFSNQFCFDFYRKGKIIRDIPIDCRNNEPGVFDYKAETYTIRKSNFDFIRVTNNSGISNIIIPNFPVHQDSEAYDFAVDLGTSNTHIEFKKSDDTSPESFNYKDSEAIFSTFFVQSYREIQGKLTPLDLIDENDLMVRDFIPAVLGADSDFSFPTRTALSYAKSTDWTEKLRPFGLINFDITYNKKLGIEYNAKPLVNIKWGINQNAQSAIQAYIRNVMMIIRNKVIANNGNLSKTKITWFYPNSMSPRRLALLRNAWNESYTELFDRNGTTRNLSESVAPIRYYFRRYAAATNLVNVDIGGGTTDIAFSSNGKVEYITSFKFATNSLFEDSFSDINPNNGIVDWFKNDILELLKSRPELNELVNIFNSNLEQPANMASFLFSLKDNSATQGLARDNIDFNKILQNDTKFKIVFIIFYTAIIYHIAQIVKTKELRVPRHIAFSGNGSKIINIISSDPKILSQYTKIIFEKVLDEEYGSELDILGLEQDTNPKESTCKGGLITSDVQDDKPETLVLRDSSGKLADNSDTYASITDALKADIVNSVKEFFQFTLDKIPNAFNLDNNFGVDNVTLKIAREECMSDLDTYLDKGIELSVNESGNKENPIEDAITFYPIKGILQSISNKIQEYYLNNPS